MNPLWRHNTLFLSPMRTGLEGEETLDPGETKDRLGLMGQAPERQKTGEVLANNIPFCYFNPVYPVNPV